MRRMTGLCVAVAVLAVAGFAFGQEVSEPLRVSNWPAPALWSLPAKVMEKGEVSPEEAQAVPTAPLHFVGLTPCRLVDTRGNGFTGQYGPPVLVAGAQRSFTLSGQCGISATAQAVSLNVTVTNTQGPGFILIYPTGGAQPTVSTLNYVAGQTVANAAVVPLGTGGAVTVVAGVSGTDLIIDTNGDYRAGVVTNVTAGTGLTGGGTGAVTLSVAAGSGAPSGGFILGNPADTTIIGAGFTETGFTQDFWLPTSTTGAPGGRALHRAVWTGSRMIVWGGFDGTNLVNTGGRYDPVGNSWSATTTTGAPSVRSRHTAVWTGTRMIIWGGDAQTGPGRLNTGGQYDPVADSWSATTTTGAPTGRDRHTAVWTGTAMIVWGGSNGAIDFNTGGQYDPVGNSWSPTETGGAPTERADHTAVWTGTSMIVWGGGLLNTGGQYYPIGDVWTPTTTTGAPTGRSSHTAIWTGTKMIVWGGFGGAYLNTGGQYDPVANSWSATTAAGAPTARTNHTAVWTGTKMIVWGGAEGSNHFNTGGQYDPAGNSWTSTATAGAPSARTGHTAVWTDTRMIVWGGLDPNALNTGGRHATLSLYVKN